MEEQNIILDDCVFITGHPRSGTTLVDKLAATLDHVAIFSQPIPLVLTEAKKAFFQDNCAHFPYGGFMYYPINDMFAENYYDVSLFAQYLEAKRFSEGFFREAFDSMADYSGQYTKSDNAQASIARLGPCSLAEFIDVYLKQVLVREPHSIYGLKETNGEEFLPYFLSRGAKIVLILRDPRDVLTSLNYGEGRKYTGRSKPVLFNIRQWRKSVAFAAAYGSHPSVLTISYEDLVLAPADGLDRMRRFLGIESQTAPTVKQMIRDQEGEIWTSNSSHGKKVGIDAGSVGRYHEFIAAEELELIEALCLPEMRWLSYVPQFLHDAPEEVISHVQFEETLEREELRGYLLNEKQRALELQRWHAFQNNSFSSELFLFQSALQAYRNASAEFRKV